LTDDQIDKFSAQLSDVLGLFKKIDGLDLSGVEETSQVTGLKNICRDDEVKKYALRTDVSSTEMITRSPMHEGSKIVVPKVIEDL
jgi:aspartyl/glutamyl-tRNA(Asn/Gln) amidotransferase C subunit